MGLRKFEKCDDIPEFPRYKTEEEYHQIIENYLNKGAIAKGALINGGWYLGNSRSTYIATWNGTQFEFIRKKFGESIVDTINHFEEDDGHDLFIPFKMIEI